MMFLKMLENISLYTTFLTWHGSVESQWYYTLFFFSVGNEIVSGGGEVVLATQPLLRFHTWDIEENSLRMIPINFPNAVILSGKIMSCVLSPRAPHFLFVYM